jgi:integrase
MATIKLTEKSLASLPAPTDEAQAYYWDDDRHGFGVVVGRTGRKTIVVRGRANGALRKATIGVFGAPRDSAGHTWTVQLAWLEARKLLGQMAEGKTPAPSVQRRAAGPTLRDGLELHVANMRKRECSERSISTIESEVPRLLEAWMDRPVAELTGADLVGLHDTLTSEGKKYLANLIVAQVSAVWNALDRVHELAGRNPARAVTRNRYTPSRERVADGDMSAWWTKVQALPSPVRRDLQTFCLFTGMRSEAARYVRWEHVAEKRGALTVPKPKGGEKRAFKLPLPKTVLEMLVRRRRENRDLMGPYGGDHGWVFPSLSRDAPFTVQPVAEPKEYKLDPETKRKVSHLPGLHTLRRTYLSVAAEAGVSDLDRHVLANHAYGRQSVNATYIEQAFEHLAGEQAKIEAALWKRLEPNKGRARRRAA